MPSSTLRPCSYPGCSALVRHGRCAEHLGMGELQHSEERMQRQRLYGRMAWQRARQAQLARHPWCEECLRANVYTPAEDVHHKQKHAGNPFVFVTSPLESLCHACHSKLTMTEVRAGQVSEGMQS